MEFFILIRLRYGGKGVKWMVGMSLGYEKVKDWIFFIFIVLFLVFFGCYTVIIKFISWVLWNIERIYVGGKEVLVNYL